VSHLSSAGAALSGTSGYTAGTINFPDAIAMDGNHNAWVGNQTGNFVNKVAANGTVTSYNCCNGPNGLALDQAGNVWIANFYGESVSEISASGAITNGGSPAGATLAGPQGIAIDGAGNVWVGNFRAGYLTELAGASSTTPAAGAAISPVAGWAPDAKLEGAFSVAIDASGNLWVTDFNNDTITEFVGMASPVKTPLVGLPVAP
jgi:streptogramin lyase